MRTRSLWAGFRLLLALIVTSAAALGLAVSPASAADRWTDISDATWDSVYGVTAEQVDGVADGFLDGTFRPYVAITRGQFTKMAVNGLNVETVDPAVPTFTDVPRSYTFFVQIEAAAEAALVGGYSDGSFQPGRLVTRQQANTILARYLAGAEFSASGFIRGEVRTYPSLTSWFEAEGNFYLVGYDDHSQILDVHEAGTAYLVYREVVVGSGGKLRPAESLTRGQAAALVLRTSATLSEITTPPRAPTALLTVPEGPAREPRPYVSGKTIPGGNVAVYDSFGGATVEVALATADSSGNFSARIPALLEGTHSFTAKVKNELGLVSAASAPATYILDLSESSGSILSPAPDSAVPSRRPSFTASAIDPGSGVASVAFQYRSSGNADPYITVSTDTLQVEGSYEAEWGDISLPDGSYDFRAVVTDTALNQRVLGPISVIVDLQTPTVTLLAPVADETVFTTSRTPLFAAAAADAPSGQSVVASGAARVDFLYALRSGLPTLETSWTAAAFTLLSSDDSLTSDDSSGLADWGTTSLADGDYIFAVQSFDRAGNSSALDWQRVVVDNLPPVVAITAPLAGAKLMGGSSYNITWTATDTYIPGPPATPIKIEYSADGGATWATLIAATENDGTYAWTAPAVSYLNTAKIRVTAMDGTTPPNATTVISGAFTIESPPSNVMAGDDDVNPHLDGRDFTVTWTPSVSPDVVKQRVYILPSTTALVLTGPGAHTRIETLSNNTTATWQGTIGMTNDSAGAEFDPLKAYQVWIVAEDGAGNLIPSMPAAWPADPPAAPTGLTVGDNDATTGLDLRDFTVTWTDSTTPDVLAHDIYILPATTALVLKGATPHTPVAAGVTSPWTGLAPPPGTDSAGSALIVAAAYTVYVVAIDDDGRTAFSSATLTPTSD